MEGGTEGGSGEGHDEVSAARIQSGIHSREMAFSFTSGPPQKMDALGLTVSEVMAVGCKATDRRALPSVRGGCLA